jgi:hypothetical protein
MRDVLLRATLWTVQEPNFPTERLLSASKKEVLQRVTGRERASMGSQKAERTQERVQQLQGMS